MSLLLLRAAWIWSAKEAEEVNGSGIPLCYITRAGDWVNTETILVTAGNPQTAADAYDTVWLVFGVWHSRPQDTYVVQGVQPSYIWPHHDAPGSVKIEFCVLCSMFYVQAFPGWYTLYIVLYVRQYSLLLTAHWMTWNKFSELINNFLTYKMYMLYICLNCSQSWLYIIITWGYFF